MNEFLTKAGLTTSHNYAIIGEPMDTFNSTRVVDRGPASRNAGVARKARGRDPESVARHSRVIGREW